MLILSITWPDAISQYLDYITFERRLSPHTQENYQRDLSAVEFFFTVNEFPLVSPNDVVEADIRRWSNSLHRQGLGRKTIQRKLSSLRSFFRYHVNRRQIRHNPVIAIRSPKAEKNLPQVFDIDELNHLLDMQAETWIELRDKAMVELLYSSGLRLSELAALNIGSFDFSEALVKVLGKGNKERILPVGSKALEAIKSWLVVRESIVLNDDCEGALFLSNKGLRLGHRSIQLRLEKLGLSAGASQRLHPHLMRHSFASHMLQSSSDIRAVQELLGHSDISTTQIYTHLDFQHLAKAYDSAHPRANKKK